MKKFVVLVMVMAFGIVGCKKKKKEAGPAPTPTAKAPTPPTPTPTPAKMAVAALAAKSGSKVAGKAIFTQMGNKTTVMLEIANAKAGVHAAHIHEKGDCSSPDGKSAGGHWNPSKMKHGKWGMPPHHMGDLGNITVGADGKGTISVTSKEWQVGGGSPTDVVGKAIIVHTKADDFKSQPTGAAGGRIACGVIKAK